MKYTLQMYQIREQVLKSHNVKVLPQSVHVRNTIYSGHLKNKINFAAVSPLHVGSGRAESACILGSTAARRADSAFSWRDAVCAYLLSTDIAARLLYTIP